MLHVNCHPQICLASPVLIEIHLVVIHTFAWFPILSSTHSTVISCCHPSIDLVSHVVILTVDWLPGRVPGIDRQTVLKKD